MDSKQHLENSLAKIRSIFEKASARIEDEVINKKQKVPATKLADELAKELGMTGPALYPTIKFLLDGYPNVLIKKGAHGGICPLPAADTAVVATDATESTDTE